MPPHRFQAVRLLLQDLDIKPGWLLGLNCRCDWYFDIYFFLHLAIWFDPLSIFQPFLHPTPKKQQLLGHSSPWTTALLLEPYLPRRPQQFTRRVGSIRFGAWAAWPCQGHSPRWPERSWPEHRSGRDLTSVDLYTTCVDDVRQRCVFIVKFQMCYNIFNLVFQRKWRWPSPPQQQQQQEQKQQQQQHQKKDTTTITTIIIIINIDRGKVAQVIFLLLSSDYRPHNPYFIGWFGTLGLGGSDFHLGAPTVFPLKCQWFGLCSFAKVCYDDTWGTQKKYQRKTMLMGW